MLPETDTDTQVPRGRRRLLELVFICQAVDEQDPGHANTTRWIATLARKSTVRHVSVLALRTGRHTLPPNVDVYGFGRPSKLATLLSFYRGLIRSLRSRPDCFFVHQGGPYPALLLPFKILLGIPIVQWKCHSVISRVMAFYARWCDDLILTATPSSFPMDSPKVRVVGHGIDTELFRMNGRSPTGDLVTVCRIGPVKRVEEMVKAVVQANRHYGTDYKFDIYGPVLPGDEAYAARVRELIEQSGARGLITLHGGLPQTALVDVLTSHRAFLNFSTGAIDRSALEAMACGLPVLSTNGSVAEVTPLDLRKLLITDGESTEAQARVIHDLLQKSSDELGAIGRRMRGVVVADHNIDRLFDRIPQELAAVLRNRRRTD